MRYEVEQKHLVEDVAALVAKLAERGAALGPAGVQSDRYFAHPCRNFAETDEALRIRTVRGASFVTYKGPKIDATTKTRRELELPLAADDVSGERFAEFLAQLGFTAVATVEKQRRHFHLPAGPDRQIEGALDDVEGLGTFVELELAADDAGLSEAKKAIRELADDLALGPTERRSYLELLLEKQSGR